MNIHEYQAKQLLRDFGVAVLRGGVAATPEEAVKVADGLGGPVWVIKAQIHAGGRGKGGGVKVVKSLEDVRAEARRMLGMTLVTPQTGPKGKAVRRVYIEEGCDIAREIYLGILIDRATSRVTVMASSEGGIEIEEVAATHPERIIRVAIDPALGLMPFHARKIAYGLGLEGKQVGSATKFLTAMYKAFVQLDASVVEINPLVVTGAGEIIALDAKMNFDDNALFRHKDVEALRDESEEDPTEREASRHELNYIKLDGSIGCMVNGAGLAMTTMDLVKRAGGEPANFLDIGGGARSEKVAEAMRLILADPKVNAILVNIFGGITRGDEVARGLIDARSQQVRDVPMVVRIVGTNAEEAGRLLQEAHFETAATLDEAAAKAVEASRASGAGAGADA